MTNKGSLWGFSPSLYTIALTCQSAPFTSLVSTHKFEHNITFRPTNESILNLSCSSFGFEHVDPLSCSNMDREIGIVEDNNM